MQSATGLKWTLKVGQGAGLNPKEVKACRRNDYSSSEFKAQVGLEALKGIERIQVIAQRHEVHPVQVSQWKKEVAERLPEVFAKPSAQVKDEIAAAQKEKELYARIVQLQMELE